MDKLLWKVIQFLSESVSDSELELSLLDGQDPPRDASAHSHRVRKYGHVTLSTSGASFDGAGSDGAGSYLAVSTFELICRKGLHDNKTVFQQCL